jgi:hypothetical protein
MDYEIGGGKVLLFAVVDDEISAVDKFKCHIKDHGEDHVPYIFMTPTVEADLEGAIWPGPGGPSCRSHSPEILEGRVNFYKRPVDNTVGGG